MEQEVKKIQVMNPMTNKMETRYVVQSRKTSELTGDKIVVDEQQVTLDGLHVQLSTIQDILTKIDAIEKPVETPVQTPVETPTTPTTEPTKEGGQ